MSNQVNISENQQQQNIVPSHQVLANFRIANQFELDDLVNQISILQEKIRNFKPILEFVEPEP